MTNAAVAAYLGQTLDVKRGLTAKVALNDISVVDALTELCLILIGEVLYSGIGLIPVSARIFLRWFCRYRRHSQAYFDSLLSLGRSTPAIRAILFDHSFRIIIPHYSDTETCSRRREPRSMRDGF